jgi:crotonyl-CoA carboxylase/reductase
MPAVAMTNPLQAAVPKDLKDLYEIGEVPPLGHVPARMHA